MYSLVSQWPGYNHLEWQVPIYFTNPNGLPCTIRDIMMFLSRVTRQFITVRFSLLFAKLYFSPRFY